VIHSSKQQLWSIMQLHDKAHIAIIAKLFHTDNHVHLTITF